MGHVGAVDKSGLTGPAEVPNWVRCEVLGPVRRIRVASEALDAYNGLSQSLYSNHFPIFSASIQRILYNYTTYIQFFKRDST